MIGPESNDPHFIKWLSDNGDYVHNLNHNLNDKSFVIDVGGYKGAWAKEIEKLYNPNILILEPIPEFCEILKGKFFGNPKIKVLNIGAGNNNKEGIIYVNEDTSSSKTAGIPNSKQIKVDFKTMDTIINECEFSYVDLVQINIEGGEYDLLENMIKTGIIKKIKTIQIQFHRCIENYSIRRDRIKESLLAEGFLLEYDYPFVWERWTTN